MKTKSRYRACALTLAVVLCVVLSLMGSTALAVENLEKDCSLTVTFPKENADLVKDADTANIVIDLYQMANLTGSSNPDSGSAYDYNMLEPFTNLKVPQDATSDQLTGLAQQAAALCLGAGSTVKPVRSGASLNEKITKTDANGTLKAGLYLMVPHGSDIQNYVETVATAEGANKMITIARSGENHYTFEPQLVTLSGEGQDADETVILKPETDKQHFTKLEIVKTLQNMPGDEIKEKVTFSFNVEAELEGKNVYKNVETITFDPGDPLTKTITLANKIPEGASVTVKEVDVVSGYSIVGSDIQTATITLDDVVSVKFTNKKTTTTTTTTTTNNNDNNAKGPSNVVKTGDELQFTLFFVAMIVSGGLLLALMIFSVRKKK